jgi:hypothetical protein
MNITVVNKDKVIVIDGEGLNFDFTLADNIWAIQWNGTLGHIEFSDGTPNEELTDFSDYQYLADAHATEKQRLADEATQVEVDRIANMTYADHRETEYPPYEDYLDGIVKGDTAQVDKYIADCQAVKLKYPKEVI